MGELKTVGLYLADSVNQYFRVVCSDAHNAAIKAGLSMVVHFADRQASKQARQIHDGISAPPEARPAAIIAAPVRDNSLNRLARQAASMGIGWVFLHRGASSDFLDELRGQFPGVPICLVTPDHKQIGAIQSRQILSLLPEGGSVLYVHGSAETSSAHERLAAVRESINGKAIELQALDGNWTANDTERVVGGWLRIAMSGTSKLDLIVCQSDEMSVGARAALESTALYLKRPEIGRIPITGCDGLPNVGQKMVREGKLIASIILPSSGGPAVDAIARALLYGHLPPKAVTLSSVSFPDETVLAQKRPRAT